MRRIRLFAVASVLTAQSAAAQQLGTKVMGGLGIDAGTQGPPGLFLIDRFVQFEADRARDRNGAILPVQGLDILARANAFGVAYTFVPHGGPYVTVAASIPYARVSVNSDNPVVSIDRFGVGDMFFQPIKAGWRKPRYDVLTSYAFFAPTGKFEPRNGVGVGRGYWTHQFSLGGAVYGDTTHTTRASALMSYDLNRQMRAIDVTRGDMLGIQGGAGATVFKTFVVGVAGYALWQVRDDRGAALPPVLAGARTRTYGLGPEVDVVIPKISLRGDLRYEWDFGTRARPQGTVLVAGLAYRAWGPPK